jgi:tRNA pseudouridine55 synthase
VTQQSVDKVVQHFTGPIRQTPPMYSALKKDGRALYEYARAGIEVEREAREITIHELEVTLAQEDSASPAINMTVTCSKGTYIRTLGEDIGEALGCGAHLSALRRVGTGGFDVSQCVTLAALEAMTDEERIACLMPVESLLVDHTVVMLAGDDACGAGAIGLMPVPLQCLGLVWVRQLKPTRPCWAQPRSRQVS